MKPNELGGSYVNRLPITVISHVPGNHLCTVMCGIDRGLIQTLRRPANSGCGLIKMLAL